MCAERAERCGDSSSSTSVAGAPSGRTCLGARRGRPQLHPNLRGPALRLQPSACRGLPGADHQGSVSCLLGLSVLVCAWRRGKGKAEGEHRQQGATESCAIASPLGVGHRCAYGASAHIIHDIFTFRIYDDARLVYCMLDAIALVRLVFVSCRFARSRGLSRVHVCGVRRCELQSKRGQRPTMEKNLK